MNRIQWILFSAVTQYCTSSKWRARQKQQPNVRWHSIVNRFSNRSRTYQQSECVKLNAQIHSHLLTIENRCLSVSVCASLYVCVRTRSAFNVYILSINYMSIFVDSFYFHNNILYIMAYERVCVCFVYRMKCSENENKRKKHAIMWMSKWVSEFVCNWYQYRQVLLLEKWL